MYYRSGSLVLDFDTGALICILPEETKEKTAATVVASDEMKSAIQEYVDDIKKGKVRTKAHYKRFEEILNKIPNDF